jgi:endonuclease III
MNIQKRSEIFKRFSENNPQPVTELQYGSPFELLIAVILSARATDKSVNKATPKLFQIANTPQKMLDLGEAKLKDYIKNIGLYISKARHILQTCALLVRDFQSEIPNTRAGLESLPGVGRKTANVILNTIFGHSTIAVDTHIFRVAKRIGLSSGKTPRTVEEELLKSIPKPFLKNAHHWLVLHGRYICVARKPKCAECLIRDLCEYPFKT